MPGTEQKARLECCECGCQGCCVPRGEDGSLLEIPFEISAPNCPSLNGASGVFVPLTPTPGAFPVGPCGPCPIYCTIASISIPGQQPTGFENPSLPGTCLFTPCSTGDLCLILACPQGASGPVGLNECCGRLELWIGSSIELEGETAPTGPGQGSCSGFGDCTSWRKFTPSTCSCEGGLSAEFDISGLQFYCDPDNVWGPGPCAGEPTCCQVSCDLTDATLVI